jgi:hypothetical protein
MHSDTATGRSPCRHRTRPAIGAASPRAWTPGTDEHFGQLRRRADGCADDHIIESFHKSGAAAYVHRSHRSTALKSVRQGRSRRSPRSLPIWENGGFCAFQGSSTCCLPEVISSRTSAARSPGRDGCSAIGMGDLWKPADTFKERAELDDRYHRGDRPWMLWEHNDSSTPGAAARAR